MTQILADDTYISTLDVIFNYVKFLFVSALVRSYYTKVQSRFSSNQTVPTNKFVQFQSILKSFDPSKETPVDLYKKIEQLFGVEHKDFVEDFLLFLKPAQAVQVGRLSDHTMLTRITYFIELLQVSIAFYRYTYG